MEPEYLIKKLEEQKTKSTQIDIEVWLMTTYSYIEEYFKSYSPRATSFYQLITDHKINKTYGVGSSGADRIRKKGIEFINEIIQYLNESIEQQKLQSKKDSGNTVLKLPSGKGKVITQLPFGISPPFFWTIFAALISAAFILGQSIGNTKFDREKIDFYDQIKFLKADTIKLNETIEAQNAVIKQKNIIITNIQDSLDQTKTSMDNMYLLLDKMKSVK